MSRRRRLLMRAVRRLNKKQSASGRYYTGCQLYVNGRLFTGESIMFEYYAKETA